jgi:hypothetical protein
MSKRVIETDPKLEKAFALADALQAARQPLHPAMRLGDMIDALSGVKPDAIVEFDFGGFQPTGIASYRGYYSDLALSFGEDGMSAGDLQTELIKADGSTFTGYKGGDYVMDRRTPVWVANYGRCHGVAVASVDDQDWRVIIRTAMIG